MAESSLDETRMWPWMHQPMVPPPALPETHGSPVYDVEFSERVWQELSGVLEAYLGKVRENCCGLWRPAALICQSKWLAEMFNHTLSAIKKKMNTFIETWPYQVKRTTYEWRLLVTTSNIWNTVIETWLNQVRKKYICVIIFCAHNIVD